MYRYEKHTLPPVFDTILKKTNQVHAHNTRRIFHVPLIINAKRQNTIIYQGPIIGNHIYDKLNMRANSWALISFKVHLRIYLLNNEINL